MKITRTDQSYLLAGVGFIGGLTGVFNIFDPSYLFAAGCFHVGTRLAMKRTLWNVQSFPISDDKLTQLLTAKHHLLVLLLHTLSKGVLIGYGCAGVLLIGAFGTAHMLWLDST